MHTPSILRSSPQSPDNLLPGMVALSLSLPASAAAVWHTLTDADSLSRWFGTLHAPLRAGQESVLDFEDGDYFTIEHVRMDPPHALCYDWRFLGIGPQNAIEWLIVPDGDGCRLTDTEAERTPEGIRELREGWLDFTGRLERFLATRCPTRYDWRREFDAAIEIPRIVATAWDTLTGGVEWLPWFPSSGVHFFDGPNVVLSDDLLPARFQVSDAARSAPDWLSFQLSSPDWSGATFCRLALSPRQGGALLTVGHSGWERIGASAHEQRAQRKRFAACWIGALKRAQQRLLEADGERRPTTLATCAANMPGERGILEK